MTVLGASTSELVDTLLRHPDPFSPKGMTVPHRILIATGEMAAMIQRALGHGVER
jgi:hypothetical protein